MRYGKALCETLKGIRCDIALSNGIDYTPTPCDHEGDCAGTCPACEGEMRWLESQLRSRRTLGKAVVLAGMSLGLVSLPSCIGCSVPLPGSMPEKAHDCCDSAALVIEEVDPVNPDSEALPGKIAEPQEIDGVTQPEDPNDNCQYPSKR